jgi:serine/threonine-protein kinase
MGDMDEGEGAFSDALAVQIYVPLRMRTVTGEASSVMGPSPGLVLAMAQHRQGQKDQARDRLAAAISSYNWSEPKADSHDAWIAHILRREAESMILSNQPADK